MCHYLEFYILSRFLKKRVHDMKCGTANIRWPTLAQE
jgi:hypothetical protein